MNNYLLPPWGGLRGAANSNPSPREGGERLSHRAYKSYDSHKTNKSYGTPSPSGGAEGASTKPPLSHWRRLKGTHK